MTTGLTNDFVELTINSMKRFALFVTTKQSACNFSGPPRRGRKKKFFFARFPREPGPPINIFVILTLTGTGDCYAKLGCLRQWAIYGASMCSLTPSASSSTDVGGNGESGEFVEETIPSRVTDTQPAFQLCSVKLITKMYQIFSNYKTAPSSIRQCHYCVLRRAVFHW